MLVTTPTWAKIIITTNWINIVGVFIIVVMYVFIDAMVHSATLIQAFLGALFSVCLYGMMFWGLFIVSLLVLDLLLIVRNQNNLKAKLLMEWITISIPFIYWTMRYSEWVFLVAVLTFLLT